MKINTKVVKNMLEPTILNFLKETPMHGYAIMAKIHRKYGVWIGASSIYPTLNNLETEGLVSSTWDMNTSERPRKVFFLTPNGRQTLHEYSVELKIIAQPIIAAC